MAEPPEESKEEAMEDVPKESKEERMMDAPGESKEENDETEALHPAEAGIAAAAKKIIIIIS
eukprot:11647593-Karenia_brevis.AAC.1